MIILNILSIRILKKELAEDGMTAAEINRSSRNRTIGAGIALFFLMLIGTTGLMSETYGRLILLAVLIIIGILAVIKFRIEALQKDRSDNKKKTFAGILAPLMIIYLCIGLIVSMFFGAWGWEGDLIPDTCKSAGVQFYGKPTVENNSIILSIAGNRLGYAVNLSSKDVIYKSGKTFSENLRRLHCEGVYFCCNADVTNMLLMGYTDTVNYIQTKCTDTECYWEDQANASIIIRDCNFKRSMLAKGIIEIPYINPATTQKGYLDIFIRVGKHER